MGSFRSCLEDNVHIPRGNSLLGWSRVTSFAGVVDRSSDQKVAPKFTDCQDHERADLGKQSVAAFWFVLGMVAGVLDEDA